MTPERADGIRRYLDWRSMGVLGGAPRPADPPTAEEHAEIRALWDTMPGWTCYWDAVNRISKRVPFDKLTPEQQRAAFERYHAECGADAECSTMERFADIVASGFDWDSRTGRPTSEIGGDL